MFLPLLFLTGCSSLPDVARVLKGDNATVVVKVNTVYGTGSFIRTNPDTNHSVTISPDGTVAVNQFRHPD
jgi:hypothetical protein